MVDCGCVGNTWSAAQVHHVSDAARPRSFEALDDEEERRVVEGLSPHRRALLERHTAVSRKTLTVELRMPIPRVGAVWCQWRCPWDTFSPGDALL
jgi:hypothetical protein